MDKATAAKAERIEEDLEDVFHNCTRSPYNACVTSSLLILVAATEIARSGTSTWSATRRASSASAGRPRSGATSGASDTNKRVIFDHVELQG